MHSALWEQKYLAYALPHAHFKFAAGVIYSDKSTTVYPNAGKTLREGGADYTRRKRDVNARAEAKSPEIIAASREYGQLYFDGPRSYGYGGYRYDGRWVPIAEDMVKHFDLRPGDRVLDVGCAKGFLVKDLMKVCPGLEAFGLDISEYAVMNCEPEVTGRLHLGNAKKLPFPDNSFKAVISLNTIHNLDRPDLITALREIERLAPGRGFVQVDSYRTPEEKALFLEWVLTAHYHDYPEGWIKLFKEAGYTGDYYWTIVEQFFDRRAGRDREGFLVDDI